MISLDFAQETPTSATGAIVEPKGDTSEGTLSFSALLQGVKKDVERPQNSALLLSFDDISTSQENTDVKETKSSLLSLLGVEDENKGGIETSFNSKTREEIVPKNSKNTLLSSLLSRDINSIDDTDFLELNSEIQSSLSSDELKQLVQDAKTYLKDQILASDGFKRSEVDKLPKTLQGLADAAKKIGIDISKISVEDVNLNPNVTTVEPKKQTFNSISLTQNDESDDMKSDKQQKTALKDINNSLLFKEQKNTAISTEQIVNAKAVNSNSSSEMQIAKKSTDDTLKLLLRGEKSAKSEGSTLTNDFSVATAKVIAPSTTSEFQKSLVSLLNPEVVNDDETSDIKSESTSATKVDVAKADSFEVKLNEAKQMVKYLSQDVKQAIDNYKSPFTRVKVQLNPQQLGEIELTVVQRGKDLHVNLSSNNSAINTLAMNANDLKQQLQNSGINNASLNFSDNSQAGNSSYSGQQQQQKHANSEYNYFENEEENEEILSSLEIVVPNYA